MSQILHIRKDCCRLWPEILACEGLYLAFLLLEPFRWRSDFGARYLPLFDLSQLQTLADTLMVLMPVSWLMLIGRLVHSENLVGNRQFWISKPYDWKKLLAEKVLFIAVFLGFPFMAMQAGLLFRAGLPIDLSGLLYSAMLMFVLAMLPLFALATVMSSILRMIGVLLSVVGLFIVAEFFGAGFTHMNPDALFVPYRDHVTVPAVVLFCASVLALQYAKRRAWISRVALALFAAATLFLAIAPFQKNLFHHYYPELPMGVTPPFQAFAPAGESIYQSSGPFMAIYFSLALEDISANDAFDVDNVRAAIETSDGSRLELPWRHDSNKLLLPGNDHLRITMSADRAFMEKAKGLPLTIHFELAVTQLSADKAVVSKYLGGTAGFRLGEVGRCSNDAGNSEPFSGLLPCFSAFRQPPLARVTVEEMDEPCDVSKADSLRSFSVWNGELPGPPADAEFSPVVRDYLSGFGNGIAD